MFALYLTIYEIIAKEIKSKIFDLENEGQGKEEKNGTCVIRHIGDFSEF